MKSGFKMKQSPVKRGEIQGTSGYASALKAVKQSPVKVGPVGKGLSYLYKLITGGKKVEDKVKKVKKVRTTGHKLTKKGEIDKTTKAYKTDKANRTEELRKASTKVKDSKRKKLMTNIGRGTTAYATYKGWNWMFGDNEVKADDKKTENKTTIKVDTTGGYSKYKRKTN